MPESGIAPLGSRRDFDYFDDAGVKWGVNLDESNTLLANPSGDVGACSATSRLPRNVKPRKVLVTDATGAVSRECTILKLTAFAALNGTSNFTLAATDSNASTLVAVSRKKPEKTSRIIKNFDTGKTDGTP